MRWPFRRTPSAAPPSDQDVPSLAGEDPEVHPSPGLQALLARLNEDEPYAILDLGPAVGANVEYLARYRCRIHIADVLDSLAIEPGWEERVGEDPSGIVHQLLPEHERFDLILAWDVFDHLPRAMARALVRRLVELSRPGALLFLLAGGESRLPTRAMEFRIVDGRALHYVARGQVSGQTSGYPPGEVEQLLRGFDIERSYLLRHGMHEYLARRPGEETD